MEQGTMEPGKTEQGTRNTAEKDLSFISFVTFMSFFVLFAVPALPLKRRR
jgi:hypothetical protein